MLIDILSDRPSKKTLKYLACCTLVLIVIVMPLVLVLLALSNFSGTLEETQLGFNGEYVKSKLLLMNELEMCFFIVTNLFDYMFMIIYSTVFFRVSLILARTLARDTILSKIGYVFAVLGITSSCCDAMENVFLLLMASNPLGFPTWLGILPLEFCLC